MDTVPHSEQHTDTLDPQQYAYRRNRSTSDATTAALNYSLSHLENKDSYIRRLFVDYSSAFNTVVPHKLIHELSTLGLQPTLCDWLSDFDWQASVCQDWKQDFMSCWCICNIVMTYLGWVKLQFPPYSHARHGEASAWRRCCYCTQTPRSTINTSPLNQIRN
ncbi:hypothetical protein FVA96_24490 [Escherichia coli]|nr:hypothetical protein [Escherichia coli]